MLKNVLFLVTGMTPQIITETIWALACDPDNEDPWLPDEVHVLSTEDGLNQIRSRLFKDGIFEQFKKEYPVLANVQFNNGCLQVIKNAAGQALSDLKTPEDNEYAADTICDMVRQFTQDDSISLHVSIAGGRKTMGFYAGYALSLYGRAQDAMSHVLVEEKFETARSFFYPTAESYYVTDRFGKEWDAKSAKVWLAKIPFVRMKDAVKKEHQLNEQSFSEVVSRINDSFNDVRLVIDLANRHIVVNGKYTVANLPPREFAFFHWFASLRKQGKAIMAPTKDITSNDAGKEDIQYINALSTAFNTFYEDVKNTEDKVTDVDKRFFNTVKSRLKMSLEKELGLELAAKIAFKQDKKGQPFYLDVAADAIAITDTFS